ncbi:HD-GYP domain-containing protein [Streptomyces sp. NPDC007088]|uniref:HD-GYP domain-containing protein n=1 Tax=Streptomyces sp. NPDC007088 TaxID=3364773 RepID=UPI0036BFDC08
MRMLTPSARVLSPSARALGLGTALAGLGCVLPLLATPLAVRLPYPQEPPYWGRIAVLLVLHALCERIPRCPVLGSRVPRGMGTFYPVPLSGALLLPPAQAALVVVPGALLAGAEGRPVAARRLWRPARLAVACAAGSCAHHLLGGPGALSRARPDLLLPALAAVLAFWAVLALLDGALRRSTDRRPAAEAAARRDGAALRSLAAVLVHGCAALTMALLWLSSYGPPAALPALLPMYLSCWVFALYHQERAAHEATLRALVQAVDLKDRYTRGHGQRVGQAAAMIARELGMDPARAEELRLAGLLHDLGKLAVPTRVLRKDGPLTEEERDLIRLHPEYGHEMVRDIRFLDEARAAILHHHERYDGTGYPHRLGGTGIPEAARVVAVADAFDAMTSTRSYSRARPVEVAVAELERCAGSHFDPRVVAAFVRALAKEGWQPVVHVGPQTLPPPPGGPDPAATEVPAARRDGLTRKGEA